jgi:3-oxoacyl-[acyl-carrier protein] reductase
MTAEFTDRVALVTGGSRGIGRAVALRLARDGADVAVNYATRAEEAREVVQAVEALGRRAIAVACDVSKPDDVNRLVAETRARLGPIAFLVHSAGISNICDHTQLDYARWCETIDVNLNGTYLAVFAVKDEMIARRFGRIVTLSSVAALRPRKMQIHYATSKAGVIAFTRCCAEAFAPHGVRINGVAPGLTDTEMARALTDEMTAEVIAGTPLGRMGKPDEIAAVIRFLLSDESSYMTGQTITVSGGRAMVP